MCCFQIENTDGARDPVVDQLKAKIYATVSVERYVRDVVPYRWLKVFDLLMRDSRVQLTMHELFVLAKDCGLPSDAARLPFETEVQLLARFLSVIPRPPYVLYLRSAPIQVFSISGSYLLLEKAGAQLVDGDSCTCL